MNYFSPLSKKTDGFYRSFSKFILLFFLLAAPVYFAIAATVLTPGDMSAFVLDVSHWLPKNSLMIQDMEKFSEVAGKERQNVIRISWPNCKQDDPRIERFADELEKLTWPENLLVQVANADEVATGDLQKPIFDDVVTLGRIIAEMKESDPRLTDEQINGQLKSVMVGPRGTTCVIAVLATRIPEARKHAIESVYEAANSVEDLGRDQIKMFGGPVYTRQIDESGAQLALWITPFSILISGLAAWLCLRNIWLIASVFGNAILCTSWALVSMYVTNAVMDPLLMLLPAFWFVMSMSAGIHFVNYFRDASRDAKRHGIDDPQHDTALSAVGMAWRPCLLATLTTCIGLGSLCTSDILPVWRFGFHAVIGLIVGITVLFLFLPSWLTLIRRRLPDRGNDLICERTWIRFGNRIIKLGGRPALVFGVLLVVAALGFSKLEFSNKLNDQFKNGLKIKKESAWFEKEIGPLIPFEVLVRFPNDSSLRAGERLNYIAGLQERIEEIKYPSTTISATSVVSTLPDGSGIRQATRRAVIEARLRKHMQSLESTGFVMQEEGNQLWRLTVFTYDSVGISMNKYFMAIRGTVDQYVAEKSDTVAEAKITYAGLGSRMATITQKLGGGLTTSCFTSVFLITIIVVLTIRSLPLGLTAMIPNVFPVIVSFGAFGWLQPRLDIGSIMTASIAMGIAVDDTIHFMYWFQRGLHDRLSRVDSIKLAINKCGHAIASTSLICGLGFVVFFFCSFLPAARFGELLFLMLGAALIGDLLFLPALLLALPERVFGVVRPMRKKPLVMAGAWKTEAS